MSKWFFLVVLLIIASSAISLWVRMEEHKKNERIKEGDLSADDFEILE